MNTADDLVMTRRTIKRSLSNSSIVSLQRALSNETVKESVSKTDLV